MSKFLPILLVTMIAPTLFAQEVHQSATSRKYHEYRIAISEPSYHLEKIRAIAKRIKSDKEDNYRLSDKTYNALTFEEKFTYNMIHGEDSSQNCDGTMATVKEETKIFGYFPDAFSEGEITWSDRQRAYLKENRTKVISLLRATIKLRQRVGVNLKNAIFEIDGKELIPDLIAVYKIKKKDHDILSLMMLMMKEGKFPEFENSASYSKLYGEHSNYKGFLEANTANQNLIIERAMAFFGLSKK
jgi:hypothetical protein